MTITGRLLPHGPRNLGLKPPSLERTGGSYNDCNDQQWEDGIKPKRKKAIHSETPNEEAGHVREPYHSAARECARSSCTCFCLRFPTCLCRIRHEPVKNHLGVLVLIMLVLHRTIIPLKDPEPSVRMRRNATVIFSRVSWSEPSVKNSNI